MSENNNSVSSLLIGKKVLIPIGLGNPGREDFVAAVKSGEVPDTTTFYDYLVSKNANLIELEVLHVFTISEGAFGLSKRDVFLGSMTKKNDGSATTIKPIDSIVFIKA